MFLSSASHNSFCLTPGILMIHSPLAAVPPPSLIPAKLAERFLTNRKRVEPKKRGEQNHSIEELGILCEIGVDFLQTLNSLKSFGVSQRSQRKRRGR